MVFACSRISSAVALRYACDCFCSHDLQLPSCDWKKLHANVCALLSTCQALQCLSVAPLLYSSQYYCCAMLLLL